MGKNNLEISQEQEQMREQFKVLSEKVEKQNVISEKQLWTMIKGKMKAYEWWEIWVQIFVLAASLPVLIIVARDSGMPSWINIMTAAYCVLGIAMILIKKHRISDMIDYNGDIRHFITSVKAAKRLHVCSVAIGLPLALIYIILFSMEFFCATHDAMAEISTGSMALCITTALAAAGLALLVDRKKRAFLDDIITEINE
jgi:hypothetical protein